MTWMLCETNTTMQHQCLSLYVLGCPGWFHMYLNTTVSSRCKQRLKTLKKSILPISISRPHFWGQQNYFTSSFCARWMVKIHFVFLRRLSVMHQHARSILPLILWNRTVGFVKLGWLFWWEIFAVSNGLCPVKSNSFITAVAIIHEVMKNITQYCWSALPFFYSAYRTT